MNRNASFIRKIIYIGAITVLLVPLSFLNLPASRSPDGRNDRPGGVLAQLRTKYNLSQAELGDIDPASETMKLATLGMRGVAANILWGQAIEFKKTEDWDNLAATLNQIAKLQPNFLKVWEFQAHNLAYNVSVEFDDYRNRYDWVKKGIDFLIIGTRYNRNEPRLLSYVGWIISHKMGTSDEKYQFRALFRDDKDFHKDLDRYVDTDAARSPYDGKPDSWLVGYLWIIKAYELADKRNAPLRGKNPLVFFQEAPLARIYYCQALEEDHRPDEIAQRAWRTAGDEWRKEYGARSIPTSVGFSIILGNRDLQSDKVDSIRQELDELAPGERKRLIAQRRAPFSSEELEAVDTPYLSRTDQQHELAGPISAKLTVTDQEIFELVPSGQRAAARRILARLEHEQKVLDFTNKYRGTANYEYWDLRCEAEATDEAIRAHRYLFDANELYEQAKLEKYHEPVQKNGKPVLDEQGKPVYQEKDGAKERFEMAWEQWALLFQKYPSLSQDTTADNLVSSIKRYREMLINQLGEKEIPLDFKLMDLLDRHNGEDGVPTSADIRLRWGVEEPSKPSADNPTTSSVPDDGKPAE